jgi:hypothetical protein
MKIPRVIAVLALVVALHTGCGSDDEGADGSTTTTSTETTTTTAATTSSETTSTTAATTSSTASTTSTTGVPSLEQPAIWPAADVVFDTPEASAADFVTKVLGVPAELGVFQQGDSRSGEIEVLPPAETGGSGPVRSLLLMRMLGPDNGWFVLAAISSTNTITSPESMTAVAAGPVEVSGQGRGFEGLLIIDAYVAGDGNRLDQKTAVGGSTEATEAYSVTVDLSGVESGRTVLLLVRGGVGLETDPGEFSAISVVVN